MSPWLGVQPALRGCNGLSVRRVRSCDGRDEILLELAGDRLQELPHRLRAEVAMVGHGPLGVLLGEDRADESQQGPTRGEDPHDVRAALDLLVEPLERIDGVVE